MRDVEDAVPYRKKRIENIKMLSVKESICEIILLILRF